MSELKTIGRHAPATRSRPAWQLFSDWAQYEKDCEDDRVSSRIFEATDGQLYFSLD